MILGISKTYWTQAEQKALDLEEMLSYSGHEEGNISHIQRVTLMLSKEALTEFMRWEAHGSRIIKTSF